MDPRQNARMHNRGRDHEEEPRPQQRRFTLAVLEHPYRATRRSRASAAHALPVPSRPSFGRAPFVLAIALSAFLFFSLEFLAARLVLPVFGGAPAVWTT